MANTYFQLLQDMHNKLFTFNETDRLTDMINMLVVRRSLRMEKDNVFVVG